MHVIWKRPDGYLGASPEDFLVVELDGHSRIWLHKRDKEQYPFRVSGGWEEDEASRRLNHLVNLLALRPADRVEDLKGHYSDSMEDDPARYMDETLKWLKGLISRVSGDNWEMVILRQALEVTASKLSEIRSEFIRAAGTPTG